jgi:outer membrane protein OmpA-like peptidoglycan-associated protein
MRDLLRFGVILPVSLIVVSGCATRGWVRETLGKQQAETDQRFGQVDTKIGEDGQRLGTVEARVTEQGKTVEGMGTRVNAVEGSVGQAANMAKSAGERADSAMNRADGAMTRANEVDSRVTRLWNNRDARNLVETVDVRFAFGKAELTDAAQTALVGLAKEMAENPRLTVELEGYTDSAGSLDYNLTLSQRRVESVRRFLVQRGVELRRIQAAGIGPIADRSLPADQKRRVTVKLTTPVE